MARTIPSDISRMALAGAHSPELDTLKLLRRQLPDDYTVFHGVHWTREYAGGTSFGEIDFVVVNRSGDVMFIEQKNGALEESDDGLVKTYSDGGKNVAAQIARSMDKVLEKFKWQHGGDVRLKRDYLIYLPDHRLQKVNAAGADASHVVDAASRDGLAARIESLLGAGNDADKAHHDRVHTFFCQAFQVVPDIAAYRETHERRFVRQVGPAASLLANLEMSPFRLRFEGVAGSGKSLLAHQFFARQAAQGRRVLLLCFNRPLAERLQATVSDPDAGYINNFHGFCTEFLESRGQTMEFPGRPDAAFWTGLQEQVTGQDIPDEWRFDTLIVDEGQDFEPEWLEILRLFVPEDADILWLADGDQNLYGKPAVALDGFVTYRCRDNYRTPESIARFIRDTLPVEFEPRNDLPGLGAGVHGYTDSEKQAKVVDRIIQERVRQGFDHEDIVILSCRGVESSVFFDTESVGGIPLRRPTREYRDHKQVFTPGRIGYDSIYRYKGQQSPAVILVDVDPDPEKLESAQRTLYCGMTRATVRLDVVVNANNPENSKMFKDYGIEPDLAVDYYKTLRSRYEPERLKLVIVAESPPESGLYFYDDTGKTTEPLYKELTRHFLGKEFSTKAEGLRAFADAGYLLVDATYSPVNNRKDRDDVIRRDYTTLRADLKEVFAGRAVPIVLIKKNVCEILEPLLLEDGFTVLNEGTRVYFPSTGQQGRFREQMTWILEKTMLQVGSPVNQSATTSLAASAAEAERCYAEANPTSRERYDAACGVMPGGNTRSVLHYSPFPLTIERGEGARLWDVDGHCYTDFLGEYTAGLYGHSHPVIMAAAREALDHGLVFGAPGLHEVELAGHLCRRFPSCERVRFCNSGTEANLMAIGAARAATGRSHVLVFEGAYHGGVLYFAHGSGPVNVPFPVVMGRYNDLDTTLDRLAPHAGELAAILVEPMLGAGGCIPGKSEFLQGLRDAADEHGAALIFDEVMTSRLSRGGLQQALDITPDLTTFGKYLGGGFSFGAFGGRERFMEAFDPRRSDALPHAGTFNNNVLSMAAGAAGLGHVFTEAAADDLNGKGNRLRQRLNEAGKRLGIPVQVTGTGSILSLHYQSRPIERPEDIATPADLRTITHLDLIQRGYITARRGFMSLSLALEEADLDGFVSAFEDVLASRAPLLEKGDGGIKH